MTNEEFVFHQTELERKRTARGAYNKKRQGGRHVRLPSDNMTKKEMQAMNGEIQTYKLSEPMTWQEFRAMPDDIRRQYILGLRERYDASTGMFCQMFEVSKPTFWKELQRLGIKATNVMPTKDSLAKWDGFLHQTEPQEEVPEETPDEPVEQEPQETPQETPKETQELPKFEPHITIVQNDIDRLCAVLKLLNGTGAKVTIEVTL